MSTFGENALWVELDADDRQRLVSEAHHLFLSGVAGDLKLIGNILDNQRMIAGCRKRIG